MDNIKKRYFVAVIVILILVVGGYILLLYFSQNKELKQEEDKEIESLTELPEISDDFYEAVLQLSDPETLIAYLNKYFIIKEIKEEKTFTPQEFFENKEGSSNDFTLFISSVLDKNNFEVAILVYKYRTEDNLEGEQTLVAFRDVDIPKYIILTDSGIEIFTYGWSFQELLTKEENRLNIEIYKYAILPPRINNLVIDEWIDVDKTENQDRKI